MFSAVTFPVTKTPLTVPLFWPTSAPAYMKALMVPMLEGAAVMSTLVSPRLRITASEPVLLNNPAGLLELLEMVMFMNRLSMTCPLPSKVAVKTLPLGKLERGSQPAPLFQ